MMAKTFLDLFLYNSSVLFSTNIWVFFEPEMLYAVYFNLIWCTYKAQVVCISKPTHQGKSIMFPLSVGKSLPTVLS